MVVYKDGSLYDEGVIREYGNPPTEARSTGGLVKSRVKFFESPEVKRSTYPVSERVAAIPQTTRALPVPPPSQQLQQRPSKSTPREQPTERRIRYHDSFSSNLPIIDESRQEEFPVSRTPSTRASPPLLESGIEHYLQGDYQKAEDAFLAALSSLQARRSNDPYSIALVMGNLGAVYLKQNKVKMAMKMLESSLEMKKGLGDSIMMADTYNNLGNCTNLLGMYDDSLEYYRLALHELRHKRGQKSDVADALFNIGRLEIHRENYPMAEGVLREALRMAREVYGEDHVYVAETLDLLGLVQMRLGQNDAALISFTNALAVYRNLNGSLHVDVANAIFNIGLARESSKDYMDAWEAYSTAQDLFQRLGTPTDHPAYASVRHSLVHVGKLVAQQNQARLVEKHQEALKRTKKLREKREQVHEHIQMDPVD